MQVFKIRCIHLKFCTTLKKSTHSVIFYFKGVLLATLLVAPIYGPTLAKAEEEIEQAKKYGADLVEVRLDCLDRETLTNLSKLPRDLPLILTCRRQKDGGHSTLEEKDRLEILFTALSSQPAFCDIESDVEASFFDAVKKKHPRVKIIASLHDLEKSLPLEESLFQMEQKPHIEHYKIATNVQSVNEALKMMIEAREHKQLTCIGLGEKGEITRICAPLMGSEFCYAPLPHQEAVFGQVFIHELLDVYRFRELSFETVLYALIGHPVNKSLGPHFHNQRLPKSAMYVKLDVDIPELPLFFSQIRKLSFKGLSVTMPLKEQLSRFLTSVEPAASLIGSINTISFREEHWVGANTDGIGALNALEKKQKVQGRHLVILGAGGSSRAVAHESLKRGAHVTIVNRPREKAAALAEEFHCQSALFEDLGSIHCDVLINTIPVDLLFDPNLFHPSMTVMDIVYWQEETPLLRQAREKGATCIHGREMFEEQAKLQQEIWLSNTDSNPKLN